jgi:hypothetical protein
VGMLHSEAFILNNALSRIEAFNKSVGQARAWRNRDL